MSLSTASASPGLERFVEQSSLQEAEVRVDRSRGVICGVKILGLESRNGRSYRPQTLARSASLYEGARVNVDHPRGSLTSPRGYEERIGTVRNVRANSAGLYGDFHFNPKHRLAEQLLWDAEHAPENVGFSHNVTARTSREAGRVIVEEITAVQSVDLVADPATTRGLFEGQGAERWDNATQSWQPLSERAVPSVSPTRLRLLQEENRQLREELAHFRAQADQAQRRAEIDRRISLAALPAALNTEVFREQCHAAESEAALARLIHAREQDARLLQASGKPRSIEQHHERWLGKPAIDAAAFAASLR